jgi:hypothetical protein
MRKQILLPYAIQTVLGTSLLSLIPVAGNASVLLLEDFESDGEGTRYVSTTSFSDAADDYFIRTDGFTEASGIPLYSNISGQYYWAAEDVDGPQNPTGLALLDFTSIDITSAPAVRFSIDVAAGSQAAFDSVDDFMLLQFRVDNGQWLNAIAFQNSGTRYNSPLYQDIDFDGVGDGDPLTMDFRTFHSADMAVLGSSIDLRIDVVMDANLEAIAFDNITVTAVPEPAHFAVCIGLLALVPTLRRHFRAGRGAEQRA